MLLLIWLVLCLMAIALLLLFPALWRRDTYKQYFGWRSVVCPENQQPAVVCMDARHAAVTGMHGHPDVRLSNCTRWPERSQCGQTCLSQAIHADRYGPDVAVGTKAIHHLPVLLAAFAAWCVGAVWHSQYLFRPRLVDAVGLTRAQVKQMVWWISPQLLTLAACVLFAYGVAWLLAVSHRKGVLPGVLMAVLLCGAVVAASWYGIGRLPHALLVIEAGYIVLAVLIVGTIVGGLFDRLALPHKVVP
ncbi:MAG TPA: DUF1761 family protein [Acidobacteriaceae bacterium]|nr:DUF1761 family protein [Acidobacteriaceae bacterium]